MQVLDQIRNAFLNHVPLHPISTFFQDRVDGLNGQARQPATIHAVSTIRPSQTASTTASALDAVKLNRDTSIHPSNATDLDAKIQAALKDLQNLPHLAALLDQKNPMILKILAA